MKTKEKKFTYATKAKFTALIKRDEQTAIESLRYKFRTMNDGTFTQLDDALEASYSLHDLRKPLRQLWEASRMTEEMSNIDCD